MKVSQPPVGLQSHLPKVSLQKTDKPDSPGDNFEPSPPSTPLWKKALNSGAVSVGVGVVSTVAATAVLGAAIGGPDALAAPLIAATVAGPIGLVTGAIAGWKNCGGEDPSTLRKLGNAAAWGVTGAVAGAFLTVAGISAAVSGPDALGAFFFAPMGAGVGALGAAALGWKMTEG